jgi:hypothetical protein
MIALRGILRAAAIVIAMAAVTSTNTNAIYAPIGQT